MKSNCRCTVSISILKNKCKFKICTKSISPGVVKTEVFGRAFKVEDMQKAVESIDKHISNVSSNCMTN